MKKKIKEERKSERKDIQEKEKMKMRPMGESENCHKSREKEKKE